MARLGGVEGEDRERRALRRQPSRWQISFVLMIVHLARSDSAVSVPQWRPFAAASFSAATAR